MKSESSATTHLNQIRAQRQVAEQQSEIGIVAPKTLVMLLTKLTCESILSLSKSVCVVTEVAQGMELHPVPMLFAATPAW